VSRSFRPRACQKCGGDAFFDGGAEEWRCLQCGKPLLSYLDVQEEARRLTTNAVLQVLDGRTSLRRREPKAN
jgi:hypothetical protein